jgi:hypothetical protein
MLLNLNLIAPGEVREGVVIITDDTDDKSRIVDSARFRQGSR